MTTRSLPKQLQQVLSDSLNPKTISAISNGLIAAAVIVGIYSLFKIYREGDKIAATATQPVGQFLSDAENFLTGNSPVQATQAGFVLNSNYINADGSINQTWRNAIEEMHQGNAALFDEITTGIYLKDSYRYLIDGKVTTETINARG